MPCVCRMAVRVDYRSERDREGRHSVYLRGDNLIPFKLCASVNMPLKTTHLVNHDYNFIQFS